MSPNTENKNMLDNARDYIHEAVKTEEQRKAEQTPVEAAQEKAQEMKAAVGAQVDKMGSKAEEMSNDAKAKFEGAKKDVDDKTPDDAREAGEATGNIVQKATDFVGGAINDARGAIYEATKSPEEKKAEAKKK